MVLLPEVVHNPKDAEWPSKAQQVSQDTECAAEDQASPKGMTESPPDSPGTLLALRVLPLPRESHRQVRVAEGSGPPSGSPQDPAAWGKPCAHAVCGQGNFSRKSWYQEMHDRAGQMGIII